MCYSSQLVARQPEAIMTDAPTLILPVESQVRELDAKLLFACCAAERGYHVVIGSRAYVHFAVADLPRGVYVAKSMRKMSALMFSLIRDLGHEIVAWEEEALVHPPPGVFYPLRLSPATISCVSRLFAWGEENRELLAGYPHLPPGLQMHVTGNPRGDMLRPELRTFFNDEVHALQQEFGDFLLINTNFTDVNPYLPELGLFVPTGKFAGPPRFGQAGRGMPLPFAEGLRAHKQALITDFLAMIPALEQALPGMTLVLRPHPSESLAVYHELAARCSRVRVVHRGNVLPWLLACRALVHNGCTTAVESYALGVPAVSYLKTFSQEYDLDFQGLPNRLSKQCYSLDDLVATLQAVVHGRGPAFTSLERDSLIDHFVAARSGPLACERILDVLDSSSRQGSGLTRVRALVRWRASVQTRLKAALTKLNMRRPGRNRADYHDYRFPRLAASDMAGRIKRLGSALGRFGSIRIRERGEHLFDVSTVDGAAP
jgi:surface carbohydrate biosynthesis protein